MDTTHKIDRGMRRQLQTWRETVESQQRRMGWKIGFAMPADQQRLKLPSAMIGYLSSAHRLSSGGTYAPSPTSKLLVEPEVAIQMGRDVPAHTNTNEARSAIAAYAVALEIVDTTRSVNDDIEAILAGNLFHDRVVIAQELVAPKAYARDKLDLSLSINGVEVRTLGQERVPEDFAPVIQTVANILASYGEELKQGDWIITGAAAKPVPIQAGDHIALEMWALGKLSLNLNSK